MQLKIRIEDTPKHSDVATCTSWTGADEVFSSGDDHKLFMWTISKRDIRKVLDLPEDLYPITIAWPPKGALVVGLTKKSYEVLLITASDGRMYIMARGGRMEKVVQAHTGAILCACWGPDGQEILTSGEDGSIRIWSRAGVLRTTIAQLSTPVYACSWSPDAKRVLYTNGNSLVIKLTTLSSNSTRYLEWEAHSGVILSVGWSTSINLILSGGEDCKYKLWNNEGELIYSSAPYEYQISAVSWSPSGAMFAVGSYKMLRLCSRYGWSHCQEEKIDVGTVYNIQWSPDGSQFTGACATGRIVLATVVEQAAIWRNYEADLVSPDLVILQHYDTLTRNKLEYRDRVVKVELDYGHMIILTLSQAFIYRVDKIAAPAMCDVHEHGIGAINFIVQTAKSFVLVGGNLITVWSYSGSRVGTVKYGTLRTGHMNPAMIAVTQDLLATFDQETKQIQIYDPHGGNAPTKALGMMQMPAKAGPLQHISFSQHSYPRFAERTLAIIDANKDLYIAFARRQTNLYTDGPYKLDTAVRAAIWHNEACILAAVRENSLRFYYLPQVVYMDPSITENVWEDKDVGDAGKIPYLMSYDVNRVEICKSDGTIVTVLANPFIAQIQSHGFNVQLDKAHRVARFVNNKYGWSVLAALALWKSDLDIAEIAFAETGQNDKVLFIQAVKEVADPTSKKAQIQLLRGRIADAESILLNAGRIGESINVHIQIHNWKRALELALKSKENLPPLFEARAAYLRNFELKAEYLPSYIEAGKELQQLAGTTKTKKKKGGSKVKDKESGKGDKGKENGNMETKEKGKDIDVVVTKDDGETGDMVQINTNDAENELEYE